MPDELPSALPRPVLILGGGIHGAAVARELVLNDIPVVLADTGDLAAGATSKSSRLIHGGLRYLEYGDVHLVRESLVERGKLLKLAAQFVRPLRLYVPVQFRWSGLLRSALGFFKLARTRIGRRLMGRTERRAPRGFWPVRIGLWMYDLFSWGDGLPKSRGMTVTPLDITSQVGSAGHPATTASGTAAKTATATDRHVAEATSTATASQQPRVDAARYRWMCAYSDAQMLYPERCVIALLTDAARTAKSKGLPFQVIPHATIRWQGSTIEITAGEKMPQETTPPVTQPKSTPPETTPPDARPVVTLQPHLVVNCSGAWGDLTLKGIDAAATPLFAGTKGSHIVTRHPGLKALLGGHGIYAETGDRRLAFVLPFGDAVLVGTTDERWSGPPDEAVASDEEIEYLLTVVATVFGLKLSRDDIESHYSGVRPLPRTADTSNAAISRDHSLAEHRLHGVPVVTLVGGKLTTFRSVAERIASRVLAMLHRPRIATTERRTLIGGEEFPDDPSRWPELWRQWAAESGTTVDEVAALWPLYGMQVKSILADVAAQPTGPVAGSPLTRRTVHWVIEHEWVTTLDDLIERRLMLVFAPRLSRATLHDLAESLVETGRLARDELPAAVDRTVERLQRHYGRTIVPEPVWTHS
jgi:glycerol-3-phosphate dehydrogenase